nr:MAG TPA: antitoxin [Caudoviricetes sp.]
MIAAARPTQDGNWIAVCKVTGSSASGRTELTALDALRRLLETKRAS